MVAEISDHWQIQEAKQRFSEMLRAVGVNGPQIITRHGEEVAVVIDIADYHRLTHPVANLNKILLGGPKLDSDDADLFNEIEAERKTDFGRVIDLGAGA